MCEIGYILNPAKCACGNSKYLGNIIDNSVICEGIIETTKSILTKAAPTESIPTNFNEKR